MSDWPVTVVEPLPTIHPWSLESIGSIESGGPRLTETASAVYPAANLALFIPFSLTKSVTVTKLFCLNGAVVNGNIDLGIYDVYGVRLISSGSVAQAGVNVIQSFDIADTRMGSGNFYFAVAMNNIVGTLFSAAMFAAIAPAITGMAEMAAAFPLPAVAVFAQITGNYIPVIGALINPRTVV